MTACSMALRPVRPVRQSVRRCSLRTSCRRRSQHYRSRCSGPTRIFAIPTRWYAAEPWLAVFAAARRASALTLSPPAAPRAPTQGLRLQAELEESDLQRSALRKELAAARDAIITHRLECSCVLGARVGLQAGGAGVALASSALGMLRAPGLVGLSAASSFESEADEYAPSFVTSDSGRLSDLRSAASSAERRSRAITGRVWKGMVWLDGARACSRWVCSGCASATLAPI